ncbi:MAG: KpsF/GutQ family sugar-phosphate isomerase [Fimbriimonadaceae bacterium]|nr:KpsF/GutQ family sugar-phosphate isomerase [Fimbriimonadaceae bacterium]
MNAGQRVLIEEAEALRLLASRLDGVFDQVVEKIVATPGRVITCGIGKSGHIAAKAAATLSSTGTPSFFVHAAEAVHGDLGMVTKADLVLAYTYSGETDEVVRLFPSFAAQGATTVAITGRVDSSAGRAADFVLDVGVPQEACPHNLAPTTSTTAMLAVSDALAVASMEARGFGSQDFARFHPAGALGRRLTLRVVDVMRTGEDWAAVPPSATVLEVMEAMTRSGVGAACVVSPNGELAGLISDGDLRRHFLRSDDPRSGVAADLMTTGPTLIDAELLAFEALEVFQNLGRKIGEAPVVADGRPVGLLVLKDLLRAGLV